MYYENFENLCNLKNVNPSQVSKATGISTATLSSWKKGRYTPKIDKLKTLADYFEVSLDYMKSGHEPDFNEMYLNDSAFELYLKQIGWNTKYLSGGSYDISNGQVSVNISDDEFHRFESEIRHRCNEKIRGFINNSLDSNMPIAAHERTDTEVTDEMAESDLEKMDF